MLVNRRLRFWVVHSGECAATALTGLAAMLPSVAAASSFCPSVPLRTSSISGSIPPARAIAALLLALLIASLRSATAACAFRRWTRWAQRFSSVTPS